ncbi:hypothetical protein N7536_006189 [Penicillium majusculum]|nr:hypothetical protein N7536_006189 [Penicillium majusculum]
MTGSAHQSGSLLPWRQQWVLPGGLDCLELALGEFRMLEVPFTYSGSYWGFKVSIRGDRFCGYRSLYAGDIPTIYCNSSDAIQQMGSTGGNHDLQAAGKICWRKRPMQIRYSTLSGSSGKQPRPKG